MMFRKHDLVKGTLRFAALSCISLLSAVAPRLAYARSMDDQRASCENLRGEQFGNAVVRSSDWFVGGGLRLRTTSGPRPAKVPALCRAVLSAMPSPNSNITIEVWLPADDVWNGKLLGTGNGGFAGQLQISALAGAVRRGYVGANTDMGTYPAEDLQNNYDAGINHPEMVKDWSYRSTHEMTVAAKALIRNYYKKAQSRSYFVGCSTGGQQALSEAQRYPEDYDGIIAGAAGHNRTHLHATFLKQFQAMQKQGALFTDTQVQSVSKAVMDACVAKDGGAPGDTFLNNPAICSFDPQKLLCTTTQNSVCLSQQQVQAVQEIYSGVRNPRTHEVIYPGWAKGTEGIFLYGLSHPSMPSKTGPGDGVFRWVKGPRWDARTFDFDTDMDEEDAKLGPIVNAIDPDLHRFSQRGGKLILFHGWLDPVVSPYDSIVYFDDINNVGSPQDAQKLLNEPSSFSRLFMVPGLGHCGGGPGAVEFGQDELVSQSSQYDRAAEFISDPERDVLAALDRWVESGVAPERLIATKRDAERHKSFERPICSYPKAAQYDGSGDVKLASSYKCVEAPIGDVKFPAAKYRFPLAPQAR